MANLSETPTYEAGIYQIERTDAVDAGVGGNGIANLQAKQLANRTAYLKQVLEALAADLQVGIDVQAWDADLDAIAALTGTGFLRRTASNTWGLVSVPTNNTLATGRLTLATGNPLPTADLTAASTLYFTPYQGNVIALWNGTEWRLNTFSEISLSISGLPANQNHDIFIYDNAGTLTLEAVAWTTDTARSAGGAISQRNGVWVRTSNDRRYLGTIRTTGTAGQCEDSLSRRFVFNADPLFRKVYRVDSTATWTNSTASPYRPWNNNTANRVEVVCGLSGAQIDLTFWGSCIGAGHVGIGIDSTNTSTPDAEQDPIDLSGQVGPLAAALTHYPTIGYHFYQMVESGSSSPVTTFYGVSGAVKSALMGGWQC